MKTTALNNFKKIILAAIVFSISSIMTLASDKKDSDVNILSYDLGKAVVSIEFNNESQSDTKRSVNELQPAHFTLSKNMNVNGHHVDKGEYKVRLIEVEEGLALQFHDLKNKEEDQTISLKSTVGQQSDYINYSLGLIENDKLFGKINFNGNEYSFTMEIALSNTIFSYLEKEEQGNTSDWLDYYQVGIYTYKNNIDLNESYEYAEKALKADQNEYTIQLSLMYLEALGRNNDAQQLSALQE